MAFMSNNVKFWLELTLETTDERIARIEIVHVISGKNFDILVKTIEKARKRDIDLSPLVKFLKNDELNFLTNKGWILKDLEFIIHKSQILAFMEEQKTAGVSLSQGMEQWPYAPSTAVGKVLYNLHLDGLTCPTRYVGEHGGYVLNKYYDANQKRGREADKKSRDSYRDYIPEDIKTKTISQKPKAAAKKIPKAEGKGLRKSIIDKADKTDICAAGFKQEFIDSLTEREQEYLISISDLATKIMRSEVVKKYE